VHSFLDFLLETLQRGKSLQRQEDAALRTASLGRIAGSGRAARLLACGKS
jgi:hypothetical protein